MSNRLAQLSAKPRRVEVEWIDSAGEDGWRHAGDVLDESSRDGYTTCYCTGYLVGETDTAITLALGYTVNPGTGLHDAYLAPLTIPQVAVVEMKELRR